MKSTTRLAPLTTLAALVALGALFGAASPASAGVRAAARAPDSLTIAVAPLLVDARDTIMAPLGYGLADLLTTDLARSRRLTLVERTRLAAVLRELSLTDAGAVDRGTAPRAGRLLKARTLVTGSLFRRPDDDVVFSVRLTDVATTREATSFSARAPLNDILAAEKALVFRVFDFLGVQLTPQERVLVEQRPTRNLTALLAYGQAVQAEVNGQYAASARAFRRAAAIDPGFRQALTRADAALARGSDAAGLAVNLVNRPLETVPTTIRRGLATDPAFPGAQATITVNITRP